MPSRMIVGSIGDVLVKSAAGLRPEQILEGSPTTGSKSIGVSPDGFLSCVLWECTAGRFEWTFHSDEIIHVLEGSAHISPVGGIARTISAGDVVYFERGLVTEWHVPEYLKKLAVHRSLPTSLRSRIAGKVRKLLRGK